MLNSQTLAQTLMELSQGDNAEAKVKQFFSYLKEKNLNGLLPQIKTHLVRLQEKSDDFNTLVVSAPYHLSEQELKEVISITGATAETTIVMEIDPDIIGSFSARYQGTMYDGSLSNALSQMNKALNL